MDRTSFRPTTAAAAGATAILVKQDITHHLDGSTLGVVWALPFAGILLLIAFVPLTATQGVGIADHELLRRLLHEHPPFVIALVTFCALVSGIYIRGNPHGSPWGNAALLVAGAPLAGGIGATGSSMFMIRPALRANRDRRRSTHVIVFFIFLVSNIGGALTPLGGLPLFPGHPLGVDFFRPLRNCWALTMVVASIFLALFLLINSYYYSREGHLKSNPTSDVPFGVDGKFNLLLISVLVVIVLVSSSISSHGVFHVLSVEWSVKELLRDGIVLLILVVSA